MNLSNLIRGKSEPARFATATPATFATQVMDRGLTVASVATVTVAKPLKWQTAIPAKANPSDTATIYRNWLIHYADRNPQEVVCCPEASHAQILEWYPDAVDAEPFVGIADEESPKPDPYPDDRR